MSVRRDAGWHRAALQARLLSWLSLAYMAAEGTVAIVAAIAVTFFLLAPYIAYDAITTLVAAERARTSWLGIGLSIASLIAMPLLGIAKKRLGARLGSGATSGEGAQKLLCAYLAAAVLVGLVANTAFGWWGLDPVVGLGIAGLAVWEGIEAWRGEDNCC